MKQILQNLKNGITELVEVPCPVAQKGQALIHTSSSLVSVGTERMLLDFGKANLIQKARQQPDKVRMVLDKIRTDGLASTLNSVQAKLSRPIPLGYCNAGKIIDLPKSVGGLSGFNISDRVVSNGNHAEIVSVPYNLCAKIPENVSDESAAFTIVGAIALQGIRLGTPTIGESFVVTGLGLVGLMTIQLLIAHGCRVLGIDFDTKKCALAKKFGAEIVDLSLGEDPISAAEVFSRGRGVDGVLITASSKSNEPVHQAALMSRKRGRIILVGVVGLHLSRADFFEKELTFQVSCSYGPGRYDVNYEEKGQDYPLGYVRWTEQRNFEAVLDLMSAGKLDTTSLISHKFSLRNADDAYRVLSEDRSALGILLNYNSVDDEGVKRRTIQLAGHTTNKMKSLEMPIVGFIGAGNYASQVLIPAFKDTGVILQTVASSGGVSGVYSGKKYGFNETTTSTSSLIMDPRINIIVITTRHNSHAQLTIEALKAGKHVFVEKPLCMHINELEEIRDIYYDIKASNSTYPLLMVGFNRRFSSLVQKLKELLLSVSGPKSFVMTVNAGFIPAEHWSQDPEVGGGRIIGEACHFIDLLRYLVGVPMVKREQMVMEGAISDTSTLQFSFRDGSIGTIHYFANGSKAFPKERIEVFSKGRVLQLDNFRTLRAWGWAGFKKMGLWRQDKGQKACVSAFIRAVKNGEEVPIPVEEIFESSQISIELAGGVA